MTPSSWRLRVYPLIKPFDIVGCMRRHDERNSVHPIERRDFYFHKKTITVAEGGEHSRVSPDGRIRLIRYFSISEQELDEIREHFQFLTDGETSGPMTMARLMCHPRNDDAPGENNHAWPKHATVFLNGKFLLTNTVLLIK